jgi:hypothetical protein
MIIQGREKVVFVANCRELRKVETRHWGKYEWVLEE